MLLLSVLINFPVENPGVSPFVLNAPFFAGAVDPPARTLVTASLTVFVLTVFVKKSRSFN